MASSDRVLDLLPPQWRIQAVIGPCTCRRSEEGLEIPPGQLRLTAAAKID